MEVNFLRNIAVNLRAKGPAAVLCTLIVCITLLGLYGTGEHSGSALGILGGALIFLGVALAQRT